MKEFIYIVILFLLISVAFINDILMSSSEKCKSYIIDNRSKIVKDTTAFEDKVIYKLDYDGVYYTDITIRLDSDNSYFVIFWGDRNSFMWNFMLDKYFTVDISHQEFKGYDISKDIAILSILKEKHK